MPNPRTEKVYEGIGICRREDIDLLLAVGGGSTIDCAKAIAVGAKTDRDFWEAFYKDWEEAEERMEKQVEDAREWRDVINTFFFRLSGIPDERGRKIY